MARQQKRWVVTTRVPRWANSVRYSTASLYRHVWPIVRDAGAVGITVDEVQAELAPQHLLNVSPDPTDKGTKRLITRAFTTLQRAGLVREHVDPTAALQGMTGAQAVNTALLMLEGALIITVRERGNATDDQRRSFVKYQKIKALALRPGTAAEGQHALRMALVEMVRTLL